MVPNVLLQWSLADIKRSDHRPQHRKWSPDIRNDDIGKWYHMFFLNGVLLTSNSLITVPRISNPTLSWTIVQ
eukprot:9550821-Karenia_brevis.AAC.1